ncbi:transcriptional regulator, GntR family [Rhizobium sp. RU20A]|uniref:FCD domain-containing protein n=1 Tax=Rhizobium sp. RU20A TaxID=1907412 RepID=UPI00095508C2|nr:FCD domain-containing protein [Rhizobium sp. RU20A]SIR29454.1 transcriptional regulator, GntR family [Rhizobium sp. RU20A]
MDKTVTKAEADTIPTSDAAPATSVTDRVERTIEALIVEGRLAVGDRLPSERALAECLGVSRNSLREALLRLAARGRVVIRKGGNIIAEPAAARWTHTTIVDPLTPLVAGNPGFGHDVLEVRRGLEGQAAYHAAQRARPADIDAIRRCFDALAEGHQKGDAAAEARADAAFHLAIADASHNAVLRSVMSSMFGLLQSSISQSLDKLYVVPRTFERLSDQHQALVEAIAAGDADAARLASDTHIDFVAQTIRTLDEERARIERADALRRGTHPRS